MNISWNNIRPLKTIPSGSSLQKNIQASSKDKNAHSQKYRCCWLLVCGRMCVFGFGYGINIYVGLTTTKTHMKWGNAMLAIFFMSNPTQPHTHSHRLIWVSSEVFVWLYLWIYIYIWMCLCMLPAWHSLSCMYMRCMLCRALIGGGSKVAIRRIYSLGK